MNKTFFWLAIIAAPGLWSFTSAHALSITPGRTEVHLLPGHKMDLQLLVKNDHPDLLQIDISKKNWFLYGANRDTPIEAWLKIRGKTHFTLKPGQERKVPLVVYCPPKAEGVLVGMTSFKFQTADPGMLTPMISVSIYLSVDGTQHAAGEIKKLAVRMWKDQLSAGVEIASTGNVHIRPNGTLTVFDDKGMQAALFRVNEGDPVYPGQTRGFTAVRQGENPKLVPGLYVLKAHLVANTLTLDSERKFQLFGDGKIQMEGEDKPS